ncbi:MBL fold metallo-hydrolase [Bradyrhizobium brasilense]|uniref:MBL fold metallo-hydrolase n=1 Tax=Bradyrhizobium brasilense TaxID=1419277 RepID=UPI003B96979B
MGSGGNITVLSGKEGKFLVDTGISKSQQKLKTALERISAAPLKYVVNTHWHWGSYRWQRVDACGWRNHRFAEEYPKASNRNHACQCLELEFSIRCRRGRARHW